MVYRVSCGAVRLQSRDVAVPARQKNARSRQGADKLAKRKTSEELVLPPPQNVLRQITATGEKKVHDYVSDWGMEMSEDDVTLGTVATTLSSVVSSAVVRVAAHFEMEEQARVVTKEVVEAALLPVVLEVSKRVAEETQERQAQKSRELEGAPSSARDHSNAKNT
eukprot:3011515-Rhodomonas_salina.1